jgi:hypothetical protein
MEFANFTMAKTEIAMNNASSLNLMCVLLLVHNEPDKIHIGFYKMQKESKVMVVIDYQMSVDSHKDDEFRLSKIWQNDCCAECINGSLRQVN